MRMDCGAGILDADRLAGIGLDWRCADGESPAVRMDREAIVDTPSLQKFGGAKPAS